MTAVVTEDVVSKVYEEDGCSILIVVTAGVGNAVDVVKSYEQKLELHQPGTINTWVFVNGNLTEEAFIQAIMTATEAKVKVLQDLKVLDPRTGTIATGTSTDSILIAATQKGGFFEFAGNITPLGSQIGKGVYECTKEAIQKSDRRKRRFEMIGHVLAITFAFLIDAIIGDPPSWPHPVRWIGSLISTLDKKWNRGSNRKWKGIIMVLVVLLSVFLPTLLICIIAYKIHFLVGLLVEVSLYQRRLPIRA